MVEYHKIGSFFFIYTLFLFYLILFSQPSLYNTPILKLLPVTSLS